MKKAISIVAIIAGILILFSTAAPLIIGMILAIPTPDSVGIIGGADGPTAIMIAGVAGAGGIIFAIAIGVLLTVLGIWGLRKTKK